MSIKKKIFYNTFVSVLARAVVVIIGLIIISLITRYLGQNGFGDFSTILAFLFVFSVFAELGLYPILLKKISESENNEVKIFNNIFTLRFFSSFFIFVVASLIGFLFPYSLEIKIGVIIASLGYWALINNQLLMVIFQKHLKMEKVALAEVLSRLFQLAIVVLFIWRDLGFFSIVLTFSLSSIVNFIILFLYARKYILFKLEFDFSFYKTILKQSYPLAVGGILTMFYFKFDTVLLSLMKSSNDVGIYSLPYRILEVLIFFPSMFTGLIMPFLSKYALTDKDKFKNIINKSYNALTIIIIPLIMGTLVLSDKIILFLGGDEFAKSIDVLNILIFGVAIIFISNLFYNIIVALEKQNSFIWIFAIGALVNILLNLIFIPKYSYYATSVNTVITEFLVAILMLAVIYKSLKYWIFPDSLLKSFFASLIMAVALYYLYNFSLFLLLPLAVIIYVFFLYLFRGITKEDILMFLPSSLNKTTL